MDKAVFIFGLDQTESIDEKQKKERLEVDLIPLFDRLKLENRRFTKATIVSLNYQKMNDKTDLDLTIEEQCMQLE